MLDRRYAQLLRSAGFLMDGPRIRGMPVWSHHGLVAAELLAESFVALVSERYPARVMEHPLLTSAHPYRAVFDGYSNVLFTKGADGQAESILRADNIVNNINELTARSSKGPLIAGDGLLRRHPGRTQPLFRDRYIWPALQLTQLASKSDAPDVLGFHATVMERLLALLGLPAVNIRTQIVSSYAKVAYLTVSCLPTGEPTVLATLYLLSDRLRDRLRVRHEIVDVGFTGKVIAVCGMHHHDRNGLCLPSGLAPVQVGVTVATETPVEPLARWAADLKNAGLRVGEGVRCRTGGQRDRAERRWHRIGVPVVIGVDREPGAVYRTTRNPLCRVALPRLPDAADISRVLADHDARLLSKASTRMREQFTARGHLRSVCAECEKHEARTVFGYVVSDHGAPCDRCGDVQGRSIFISRDGRFY